MFNLGYRVTRGAKRHGKHLQHSPGTFQIGSFGFVGADAERMVWLYSGLWCAMVLGIIIVAGANLGRQASTQAEPIAVSVAAPRSM